MYNKVDNSMNFVDREKQVIEFWKENKVFEQTLEKTKDGEEFSFYDGPPTANGKPHIGHILTRCMKDLIPRFKTMKGCHVRRQAGWDTHGLPVELEVEKVLGMDGKQDIEKYGIEPFTQKCKESVWKYKAEWERMSERVGYWVDMDDPYVTYEDNYIESVWWALKTIADKGLIYKGHKIVPYCPRCGTALSSHEVAQGYKDVREKSAVAKFQALDADNTYYLAWTTTPWTLPSNVALCVNAAEDYATVETADGTKYILASNLIKNHFKEEDVKVLTVVKGAALEKRPYEPLFDFVKSQYEGKAWFVTCDNYVTLTDGTGIVHIAPAFGEDDAKVGRAYKLPFIQLVDERGKMTAECGDMSGKFCKDADKDVIRNLKERGLLFGELQFEHSYPFCWRCDTPLLYYARSTWFIEMTKVRDALVANNKTVNWLPESIGKGRFGNFLEGVIDWGLSRERYWGTPLPIWTCECGHMHVIGSKEELKTLGGLDGDIELHKPFVDAVTIDCPKCGKKMHRTPEVIDCWFDSGSMPFAQMHYPFENKDVFEQTFPADFISEAVDQTRGWFYTLMAISTLLFDRAAFKNCLVLGHVCDEKGEKMSKHKGNVVDPWSVLDVQGADAVRWYFYTGSSPWLPSRFSSKNVAEAQNKFMGTLWNVYSFYVLYAEIDKFDPTKYNMADVKQTVMDRWILSELNSLVKFVDGALAEYKVTESSRRIQEFVDSLSNWYVRRGRDRYWGSDMTEDKIAAYMTLHTVLVTTAKIIAPYVPFIAEELYQNLVRSVDASAPISVHLCDFPTAELNAIDANLNEMMESMIRVAVAARSVRAVGNLKNRQPLQKMYIALHGAKPTQELLDVVADEINVLEVELISDAGEFVSYELKPQLKTLGPKYGAKLGKIREILASETSDIMRAVKAGEVYQTSIDGLPIELAESDLLISVKSREGFASESNGDVTVILDTNLTPHLIELGVAREVISKIQSMRKDFGLVVTDHIRIGVSDAAAEIAAAVTAQAAQIQAAVLGVSLDRTIYGFSKVWEINGGSVTVSIEKAE